MKKYLVLLMSLSFAAAGCMRENLNDNSVIPADDFVSDNGVVPGWIRLRLSEDAEPLRAGVFTRGEMVSGNPEIDAIAAQLGATEIRQVFPTDPRFEERHRKYGLHLWYDFKIDESVSVTRAGKEFASAQGVAHVEPIYKIKLMDYTVELPSEARYSATYMPDVSEGNKRTMPFDDPMLPLQWNYDNDGSFPRSVPGADIGLFEAWEKYSYGDPSVIVAIMDEGVYHDHEDLRANMWVNEAELNGANGKDDDENGYKDDIFGYNFVDNTGSIAFGLHGTHVAGTVAAVNGNGTGVSGVAGGSGKGDGARIMSCQFVHDNNSGSPAAYVYAADNGAVISQNSWCFETSVMDQLPEVFSNAFDYFIECAGKDNAGNQTGPMKGGVLIFAAGNSSSDVAGFIPPNDPRVITVAALNYDYKHSAYTNYGAAVDLAAPGGRGKQETSRYGEEGSILSTALDNTYQYISGTSMACPHVSGVAALIVSYFGGLGKDFTNEQLKEILLRSYHAIDYTDQERFAGQLGRGIVDASLIDIKNPNVAPGNVESISIHADPYGREDVLIISFNGVPADADGRNVPYLLLDYAPEGSSEWKSVKVRNTLNPGESFSGDISGLATSTTYNFRVKAEDRFGNVSEDYVTASGTTTDHVNRPPEVLQPLTRVSLPTKDSKGNLVFTADIDLSTYFTDPDIDSYGDSLTYFATSADESIVTTSVSGSILTLTALKSGDVIVAIKVVDTVDNSIERNLSVRVSQDPDSSGSGSQNPGDDKPENPGNSGSGNADLSLSPNPATNVIAVNVAGHDGESVSLNIYDSASRLIVSKTHTAGQNCDISALAPGIYNVIVELASGEQLKATFVKK